MTVLQKIIEKFKSGDYPANPKLIPQWLKHNFDDAEQQQIIDAYNAGGQHEYGKNAYVKNPHPDLETYIQSLNQE